MSSRASFQTRSGPCAAGLAALLCCRDVSKPGERGRDDLRVRALRVHRVGGILKVGRAANELQATGAYVWRHRMLPEVSCSSRLQDVLQAERAEADVGSR